ncbi:MAG: hypothetical protein KA998_03570, partial [Rickettsiaceae bacterium]|nr:hypothetical protein [Rickettsiaceae bacterium]
TENNLSTIKTLINHGAKIDQNDDGTLDYKINFFQNEIKQASAKAQLYTKILEFLEEKKMAEEVVKAGRVLGASIAQDADATTVPTSPKEDSRKVGRR